ncbi:MAG: EamA family transporter, partial [Acidobacteria bacterium]|nr:EamA family transporter [Acidobacteriota bacterium]
LLAVTIPIFAIAIGAILGTEKLKAVKILGIICAAIGVVILIDPRNASFSSETTIGDIFIIINSLSFGIYVATSKEIITRNGPFRSMMWVFIFGSLICVPVGIFSLSSVDVTAISWYIWAVVIYIAIGATAAPYLLNAFALQKVKASTLAVYIYFQPLIGFLLAVIFLDEQIDKAFVMAAVMVFLGVFLATKRFSATSNTDIHRPDE